MKIKLIKRNGSIVRKISETYFISNMLTKNISKKLSLAIGNAKSHFETTKNIKSDRVYYVLEGELIVKEDDKSITAKRGDAIFIPANIQYQFKGTFKVIIINSPSFNQKNEKILKLGDANGKS